MAARLYSVCYPTRLLKYVLTCCDRKKVPTDPRIFGKHKAPSSNTQWYVPTEYLGLPPGSGGGGGGSATSGSGAGGSLHHAITTDTPLSSFDLDATFSDMVHTTTSYSTHSFIHSFIYSFILDIYIAPLQVRYFSEVLLTTALIQRWS